MEVHIALRNPFELNPMLYCVQDFIKLIFVYVVKYFKTTPSIVQ